MEVAVVVVVAAVLSGSLPRGNFFPRVKYMTRKGDGGLGRKNIVTYAPCAVLRVSHFAFTST
jgi:hypothetical protein